MDGSRKQVTKLSAEVREKQGEIEALEKKLREAEASLAVKETDIACLGRALSLVHSGDPRMLALLAEATASATSHPSQSTSAV